VKTFGTDSSSSMSYVTRPSSDGPCTKGNAPPLVHGLTRLQTVPHDPVGVADAPTKLWRA
jgi:hypothetical protein